MSKKLDLNQREASTLADLLIKQANGIGRDKELFASILRKLDDPVADCNRLFHEHLDAVENPEKYPGDYPAGVTDLSLDSWAVGACLTALSHMDEYCTSDASLSVFSDALDALRTAIRNEQKQ